MNMTAEQLRELDLDYWWGTITVFSPVRIGKRLHFELEKDAARYVLTFRSGTASIMWRGRAIEIGVMNSGVLELYQFGLRNEMLRHLLFPDTMQLNQQAQFARESGNADRLLEQYQSPEDAQESDGNYCTDEPDETQRCRFWNLQMCFLHFVSVDRLRYWVKERKRSALMR